MSHTQEAPDSPPTPGVKISSLFLLKRGQIYLTDCPQTESTRPCVEPAIEPESSSEASVGGSHQHTSLPSHRGRSAAPPPLQCACLSRRRAASMLRAQVEQFGESTGSATILSQLIVMATASRGVKPHTGQSLGVNRESPRAPGSSAAQLSR